MASHLWNPLDDLNVRDVGDHTEVSFSSKQAEEEWVRKIERNGFFNDDNPLKDIFARSPSSSSTPTTAPQVLLSTSKGVSGEAQDRHNVRLEIGPNPNCNRDCVECQPQYVPLKLLATGVKQFTQMTNDVDASKILEKYVAQCKEDRDYLSIKLAAYGNTILSKWKKKGREGRTAIILEVQPDLYRNNCPEQRILLLNENEKPGINTRNALLLPYLNVETLTKDPMKLLALLHHRIISKPEDWVMFDLAQMKLGFEGTKFELDHNEKCVTMCGEHYGELGEWVRAECHKWNDIGYPRARLVIEAQAILLRFLRKAVDALVTNLSSEGNLQWSMLTSSGFKAVNEVEVWSPFSNQPFSASPVFDPRDALQKAKAQLAVAEDHFYLLQTDPFYAQDVIFRLQSRYTYAGVPPERLWPQIVDYLLHDPARDIQRLQDLVSECKNIVALYDKHHSAVHVGGTLPEECNRALGMLEFICINAFQQMRNALKLRLASSPDFRHHYEFFTRPDGKRCADVRHLPGRLDREGAYFRKDPLFWALWQLTDNPEDHDSANISFLMGFIDDTLANATRKERARIDQALYDYLGSMALFGELVTLCRLHRPSASNSNFSTVTAKDRERITWRRWCLQLEQLTDNEKKKKLVTLLQAFRKQPWPRGQRDQAWLDKATVARQHLADFWNQMRQARFSIIGRTSLMKADREVDVALFAANQCEEYEAEVEAERVMVAENTARLAKLEAGKKQREMQDTKLEEVQSVWGEDKAPKIELAVERAKPKTRPDVASTAALEEKVSTADRADAGTPRPRIPVTAESMRIFAKIFPSSTAELSQKGVVRWQMFVTAMADAGFSATHTGGSAVSFELIDGGGTIVFHKPHPDPEMDAVMLQIMGKRLRKWFGWDGDVFVERVKERK